MLSTWRLQQARTEENSLLMSALDNRLVKIPNPLFTMINVNEDADTYEIAKWLALYTTGPIYITFGKVGFFDEREATMFAFKFS